MGEVQERAEGGLLLLGVAPPPKHGQLLHGQLLLLRPHRREGLPGLLAEEGRHLLLLLPEGLPHREAGLLLLLSEGGGELLPLALPGLCSEGGLPLPEGGLLPLSVW